MKIIGFDPGLNATGYGCIDVRQDQLYVTGAGTITPPLLKRQYRDQQIDSDFPHQYCTLHLIHLGVMDLLREYTPTVVACESAFAHRFPQAFASLTLVIHTIRRASHDVLHQDIELYAPKQVKDTVTGSGKADKDLMRSSLLHKKELGIEIEMDGLTEHAYDAIGVAYTAWVYRDR